MQMLRGLALTTFRGASQWRSTSLGPLLRIPVSLVVNRSYASAQDGFDPRLMDVITKLKSTPAIIEAYAKLNDALDAINLDIERNGMDNHMTLQKDHEITELLHNFVLEIKKAGIDLSPEAMKPIMEDWHKKKM